MRIRRVGAGFCADAPAKINLFLEILTRRPDGFHELETLMVAVSIYDTLEFEPTEDGRLRLDCMSAIGAAGNALAELVGEIPTGNDNLVLRAAQQLRAASGTRQGARIRLVKRIPVQAGMGGGSSDAAAALCLANRAWRLGWRPEQLMEIAAQLGSDCPFFLQRGAAICRGRGERLTPAAIPLGMPLVVAHPGVGLSTARVYQHVAVPRHPRRLSDWLAGWHQRPRGAQLHSTINRLQEPAVRLEPRLAHLRKSIQRVTGSPAMVTGSGTACYGWCPTRRHALEAAARLRAEGWPYAVAAMTVA